MGFVPSRILATVVLLAWAGLFWYLWLSGDWALYLAERVNWIVPVAAISFTIGAAGRLLTSRGERGEKLTSSESWSAAFAIVPVFLILLVPLGTLSSFAAERRTQSSLARFSATSPIQEGQPLTFQQLAGAMNTKQGVAQLRGRQGETVHLVGIFTKPVAGGFTLARFTVACCVVDATVVEVKIKGGPPTGDGAWVAVDGKLNVDPEGHISLIQSTVTPTAQPDPPYLYP